jgi:superfamily II DNA or RNA helicase
MDNQEKGILYENQVKYFIIKNTNKNAYLWNECPEEILIKNNLISSHNQNRLIRKDIKDGFIHNHKDIGIDIIQINNDNTCAAIIQCKNGYKNGICINDIAGIMIRSALNKSLTTCIYYTNILSRNIKYITSLSANSILIDSSNDLNEFNNINYQLNNIYFIKLPFINNYNNQETSKIIPYNYQLEAVKKFNEYFKDNNRGILSIPCGCGKTYISYLISNNYNNIVIISLLREFALQNLNKFIEYGYNKNKSILIDCDGIRDNLIIENIIKTNEKILISTTYKSMDIIAKFLNLFKNTLFIVDEFHNLSKSNISNNDDNIYKLLISNHKIMFMSATPRIYDIEKINDDELLINYENNFNDLFGKIVYNISFTNAIINKYITDYKIWLPAINESNDELNKEISIYKLDNQLKNRCIFLYSCILNNGSRKIIIYCKDTYDMKNMINTIKNLNDFYILDININSISCENTDKERKEVLKIFAENNNTIQLLFNIRILNECIDIPTCDSIYISYPPKNKITTIQRINRATRIDNKNPFKIANIYIWCDEYEDILETLSSIKEYDETFKDKIKININNFYNNQSEKDIIFIEKNIKTIETYKISVKEFKILTWDEKLKLVEDYIIKNNRLPSLKYDKNINKILIKWIYGQKKYINNNLSNDKYKIIKWNNFIDKYKTLFLDINLNWLNNLEKVEEYIKEHKKLPSQINKDKTISSIGTWLVDQKKNIKSNKGYIQKEEIKLLWVDFTNRHNNLFITNQQKWNNNLKILEEFIEKNKKLPIENKNDKNSYYLKKWIYHNISNYKNNSKCMKNIEIKTEWEKFVNKYKELF